MSPVTAIKTALNKKEATLEDLAQAWTTARLDEDAANHSRLQIEKQILERTQGMKIDEGTVKVVADESEIVIRFGMTRSIDKVALENEVTRELPVAVLNRLFVYKPSLDIKELRYLQDNEPEMYVAASKCITAKPSKPSIKVQGIK